MNLIPAEEWVKRYRILKQVQPYVTRQIQANALRWAALHASDHASRNPNWNSYHQDAWMEIAQTLNQEANQLDPQPPTP